MKKVIALLSLIVLSLVASVAFAVEGKSTESKLFAVTTLAFTLAPVAVPLKKSLGLQAYTDEISPIPMTMAQKVLWDYLVNSKDADVNTRNALLNRELQIATYSEALKFQIQVSQSGKIELLNATAIYRQGRIPLEYNQGFLPKGFNIAVEKIRLAFGSDAALLPEAITNYTTVAAGWPAALQHGQLIISQNNAVKEQFTGRAAGSASASFGPGIDADGLELKTPMILEEGKPIKIELFCPQSVTFPATPAILAVEVAFLGACVRPRS